MTIKYFWHSSFNTFKF